MLCIVWYVCMPSMYAMHVSCLWRCSCMDCVVMFRSCEVVLCFYMPFVCDLDVWWLHGFRLKVRCLLSDVMYVWAFSLSLLCSWFWSTLLSVCVYRMSILLWLCCSNVYFIWFTYGLFFSYMIVLMYSCILLRFGHVVIKMPLLSWAYYADVLWYS